MVITKEILDKIFEAGTAAHNLLVPCICICRVDGALVPPCRFSVSRVWHTMIATEAKEFGSAQSFPSSSVYIFLPSEAQVSAILQSRTSVEQLTQQAFFQYKKAVFPPFIRMMSSTGLRSDICQVMLSSRASHIVSQVQRCFRSPRTPKNLRQVSELLD